MSSKPTKTNIPKKRVSNKVRKALVLEALKKTFGIVTPACEMVGVDRSTYYDWLKDDLEFKNAVDTLNLDDIKLDYVESKLMNRINEGSDACTIFFLKTKGRKRGYSERVEVTGEGGQPIKYLIKVEGTRG